jgi:tRNA modification GTPase
VHQKDTIISLATNPGESALGIIRISGALCKTLSKDIFDTPCPTPRQTTLKTYRSVNGKIIDQVIFVYYDLGKSFTGEETIEITFHGNDIIAEKILEDLICRKCRLAEPGEYTKRAFLNGKIDLTQAESVAEIIAAKSEKELELAQHQLRGSLSKALCNLQSDLINLQCRFEASIDFPEDEIKEHNKTEIINLITPIVFKFKDLIEFSKINTVISRGFSIALIGPPNVGKSSIFNNLLHEKRAIVNEQPGTTRDYITKELSIGGFRVELFDTAGIRNTDDMLESEGVQSSINLINSANVILLVLDCSLPYPTDFYEKIKNSIQKQVVIIIENKSDLNTVLERNNYPPHFSVLRTSSKDSNCSDTIRKELELVLANYFNIDESPSILVNKRQSHLLRVSLTHIEEVKSLVEHSSNEEIILQELQLCLDSLNLIIGSKDNEDMLDELFKNFCIGK